MGDWIRKQIPDSVSAGGIEKGDRGPGTDCPEADGFHERSRGGSGLQGRNVSTSRSREEIISDLMEGICSSSRPEDIIKVLSERLYDIIPYEIGSLRWRQPESLSEDWDSECGEEDFPDAIDFTAASHRLHRTSSIKIEPVGSRIPQDSWSGRFEGVCRAVTPEGSPVLVRIRSTLIVPLYSSGERMGVLSFFSSAERAFEELESDQTIRNIYNAIGSTLENILRTQNLLEHRDRLKRLLDSSDDILVIWRSVGTLWEIDYNERAEHYIQSHEIEPQTMEGPFFAPPGKEWERALGAWQKAYDDGEVVHIGLDLVDEKTRKEPFLCTFSPLVEENEIVGVRMDGVEMERIGSGMAKVDRSNRTYRLILSVLSHDLKNPLSAITGYMDLLDIRTEEASLAYTDKVRMLVNRMSTTINLAGILTRLEEGKIRDFEPLDLQEVVDGCIEMLYPRTKEFQVVMDRSENELRVNCHRSIQQVILNLLDNAMKYSPVGTKVTISILADVEGVTLAVADQGSGVPDEIKETIFDSFERGLADDAILGSGMGLTISRGIVELHGGRIWVEDNKPTGSVFKVFLPWSNDDP